MVATLAPLAVWDVSRRWYVWRYWREAEEWCISHGLASVHSRTYRVEIYLMDTPFARTFSFALNDDGHVFRDPATGDAARADPVTVMLTELPPEHLMRRKR